jgi:hypothetical protein
MLGLYLASPLTRDTYLLAKAAAVGGLLAATTLGPPLLLLIANTLQGFGPDGVGDLLLVLLRTLVAGTMLAAFFTALSLVASAFTDRRAVASAAIILLLFVTGAVTNVLVEELDAPSWLLALNFSGAPFELAVRIFGEAGQDRELKTVPLAIGVLGLTVLFGLVARWRYQRLAVTR